MKKLDVTQMENLQGGKFFGTETTYGPCQSTGGTTGGIRAVTSTFYVLWLGVQTTTTFENC